MGNVRIINPTKYDGWDDLVLASENYSFFYSSSWAKVLQYSYNYKPLYFTIFNDDKIQSSIPVMEVQSLLTGRRGVSLPFSDYLNPIEYDKYQVETLLNFIIDYGKKSGWKTIQLRGGEHILQDLCSFVNYYIHTLNITKDEKIIYSEFRKGTKSSIKKAMRENVKTNISYSLESIKDFYRLNCITRKRHGLPPQPFSFFRNVYEHVLSNRLGFTTTCSYKNNNIASSVFFIFGNKAIYKYSASLREYSKMGANNLMMWETIKWCIKNNIDTLCMGRTDTGNEGLRRFKRGWGTEEKVVGYFKFDIMSQKYIIEETRRFGNINIIFSKMPVFILKQLGKVLYKHMG